MAGHRNRQRPTRDRDGHYAVYAESVRNLGTPVFPALFDAVLDGFGDDADILTVRHRWQAVASVLQLYHRGAVMPYWGGGVMRRAHWRANDVMYYALMNHARARGCTVRFWPVKGWLRVVSFRKTGAWNPAIDLRRCERQMAWSARDVNRPVAKV